jgi:hypothetical protein
MVYRVAMGIRIHLGYNPFKMSTKRTQLTLFVAEQQAVQLEEIRKTFNPLQYELIKSHVTLCREDELVPIEQVIRNLHGLKQEAITIDFGPVVRFSNGAGVFLPAIGNNQSFHHLRAKVLQGIVDQPRIPEPHVTLMHPRNSTCTDAIFGQILKYTLPSQIQFTKITLIEQENGLKWNVLQEFELV